MKVAPAKAVRRSPTSALCVVCRNEKAPPKWGPAHCAIVLEPIMPLLISLPGPVIDMLTSFAALQAETPA
jgi:hypothetical protein